MEKKKKHSAQNAVPDSLTMYQFDLHVLTENCQLDPGPECLVMVIVYKQ